MQLCTQEDVIAKRHAGWLGSPDMRCEECGKTTSPVVHFEKEVGDETQTFHVCGDCLAQAMELLKSAP